MKSLFSKGKIISLLLVGLCIGLAVHEMQGYFRREQAQGLKSMLKTARTALNNYGDNYQSYPALSLPNEVINESISWRYQIANLIELPLEYLPPSEFTARNRTIYDEWKSFSISGFCPPKSTATVIYAIQSPQGCLARLAENPEQTVPPKTILLVENHLGDNHWMSPVDYPVPSADSSQNFNGTVAQAPAPYRIQGSIPGCFFVILWDGQVLCLDENIPLELLHRHMVLTDDAEPVTGAELLPYCRTPGRTIFNRVGNLLFP